MSEDDKTTKPTIETVLERINALAQQLVGVREIVVRLEEKQDKFQAELETVKADLKAGFKKIERKVTILNDNVLTVQADNRDLENRIENIESKAS